MRISDWSSDVCSSDLTLEARVEQRTHELAEALSAQAHARQDADSANESKTRFLAALSHDVLQPLNAARLFASALRESDDSAEQHRLAERVDRSEEHTSELPSLLRNSYAVFCLKK